MPTVLASAILTKAARVLNDAGYDRWSAAELLDWLNAGQKEIVIVKPDANTVTKAVQLASGTRQTLGSGSTSDAVMLIRVNRNMGTGGATPGQVITPIAGEQLDAVSPDWHSETAQATADHYVYDPRVPLQYWVYPPNTGTGYAELTYSAVPTVIAASTNAITVPDIFENALLDYVLYRAFLKDSEVQSSLARAAGHYTAFNSALGVNTQNLGAFNPNRENLPFNPSTPAEAK